MTNRGSPKVTETQLRRAEERKKALQLRLAGATFREIAEVVGCAPSKAKARVDAALADVDKAERSQLRQIEVERLDRLQRACWQQALQGDLAAIDRSVRIIDRRAKLLGLDAPQQMEVTGAVDVDLDGAVRKIMSIVDAETEAEHGSND